MQPLFRRGHFRRGEIAPRLSTPKLTVPHAHTAKAPRVRQGALSPPALRTKFSHEMIPPQNCPPPPPIYINGAKTCLLPKEKTVHGAKGDHSAGCVGGCGGGKKKKFEKKIAGQLRCPNCYGPNSATLTEAVRSKPGRPAYRGTYPPLFGPLRVPYLKGPNWLFNPLGHTGGTTNASQLHSQKPITSETRTRHV